MSLGRILVEEFQPDVLKWLRERAEIVVVNPWIEPERWESEVARVDAVISRKGKITLQHMAKSSGRLKIIARTGVGVDPSRVDLEAAKNFGIWVTNMPGSNAVSVAELVFGQMIALTRHTFAAHRAVKENRWGDYLQYTGTELAGKTLGIVGMGNIGHAGSDSRAGIRNGFLGLRSLHSGVSCHCIGRQVGRVKRVACEIRYRHDSLSLDRGNNGNDGRERARVDEAVRLFDQCRARRNRRRSGAFPCLTR